MCTNPTNTIRAIWYTVFFRSHFSLLPFGSCPGWLWLAYLSISPFLFSVAGLKSPHRQPWIRLSSLSLRSHHLAGVAIELFTGIQQGFHLRSYPIGVESRPKVLSVFFSFSPISFFVFSIITRTSVVHIHPHLVNSHIKDRVETWLQQ